MGKGSSEQRSHHPCEPVTATYPPPSVLEPIPDLKMSYQMYRDGYSVTGYVFMSASRNQLRNTSAAYCTTNSQKSVRLGRLLALKDALIFHPNTGHDKARVWMLLSLHLPPLHVLQVFIPWLSFGSLYEADLSDVSSHGSSGLILGPPMSRKVMELK